jgi:hypothetical protein
MRSKSRSSIRWRVATAVVALTLCILPKAALPDGGGNGRLVAARLPQPAAVMTGQQDEQPIADLDAAAGATPKIRIDRELRDADYGIGDDSDVASVEGSVNDDNPDLSGESSAGSF